VKIFKYPLTVTDHQVISMPQGATILTVQTQREIPCIWAEVDPEEVRVTMRRFRIYGTGHDMPDRKDFPHYVGTFQIRGHDLVFHVYTDFK